MGRASHCVLNTSINLSEIMHQQDTRLDKKLPGWSSLNNTSAAAAAVINEYYDK